ncbi:SDR family oxidoreductase [bacterium]|nr:SDR family oxidoreductase [bacterium]
MKWKERVALITGASSGIGREAALALSRRGATVVLAARRKARLDALAAQIRETGGSALAIETDVSRREDVERLFESVLQQYKRLDWLINNAGSGLYVPIEETTPEQMERIWRTNFMGTFYCIRHAIPIMKKQGEGHILTVSSMAGVRGTPMMAAYCASKFAQVGLMDSLRREIPEIASTLILPGATRTEFIEATENPGDEKIQHSGSVQDPASVAEAIVRAIEHPASRVITQKLGRSLMVLNAISPSWTDWLVRKTIKKKY